MFLKKGYKINNWYKLDYHGNVVDTFFFNTGTVERYLNLKSA